MSFTEDDAAAAAAGLTVAAEHPAALSAPEVSGGGAFDPVAVHGDEPVRELDEAGEVADLADGCVGVEAAEETEFGDVFVAEACEVALVEERGGDLA